MADTSVYFFWAVCGAMARKMMLDFRKRGMTQVSMEQHLDVMVSDDDTPNDGHFDFFVANLGDWL